MARKKNIANRRTPAIAIIIIIIIIIIIGSILHLGRFARKSSEYIDNSVKQNIGEMIEMVATPYSNKVERIIKDLSLLNEHIVGTGSSRKISAEALDAYGHVLTESEGAECLAFLDKRCRYLTTEGESGLLDVTLDIVTLFSDREPMVRTLNWRNGEERSIFALPVDEFEVDGHTYNALLAVFSVDVLDEIFSIGIYSDQSNLYLVDNTGLALFSNRSGAGDSDNLLSVYKANGVLTAEDVDRIKTDFKEMKSGSRTIVRDGEEIFLCYGPMNLKQNIVMEVPADLARSSLTDYGSMITRTLATFALILLAFVIVISILVFSSARSRAAAREEMKRKEVLEESNRKLDAARLAAEEASNAKSVFLSNMSHDIRTPMNAIIGYTGLAMSHMDDKTVLGDYLGKISRSSSHLLNLINDVLDMSRIESGKTSIENHPENLSDIVSTIASMVHSDTDRKRLSLTVDLSGVSDANVLCDRLHINQILLNLLSNSVKYTPEGGKISLIASQLPGAGEGSAKYRFKVVDNGIGMTEDFLKTVFEPFARERNSTVSGIQGTGLGMAITKNLVDMMGGTIDIQSEKDKGTEVTVEFEFELDKAAAEKVEEAAPEYDFTGKKLLLVEDNELNREIATMILEEAGFVLDTADDGTVAVDKISKASEGTYDVVLMDIQMPVMNGYEATKAIRALDSPLAGVPIIAMTANAFDEDRKAAFAAGMNEHVAKPIDVDNLKKALSKVLS